MTDKRKSSMSLPSPKRPRFSDDHGDRQSREAADERPRNDPVYGMKNAFPGLDDGGEELFYGPAEDGLEYLRMVRSEASSLPTLFAAPTAKQASETPEVPASKAKSRSFPAGFFEDEAYIAPADEHTVASTDGPYPEAQISYYNLLRHRFLLLRTTLRCTPPATAIAALDDAHPISLPRAFEVARREWRRLILAVDPQTVQLACMDQDSVMAVLRIMSRLMSDILRTGSAENARRIGAWAWALLAKCREVGQLTTEEVGEIRELGKRAVKILRKIRETESHKVSQEAEAWDTDVDNSDQPEDADPTVPDQAAPQENADDPDSEMRDTTDLSAELEAAKARLQAKLQDATELESAKDHEDPVKPTCVLLDMVITVVGEFFGQRDLLDLREIWTR